MIGSQIITPMPEIAVRITSGMSTSKGAGMGMSAEMADFVYRWANWALVGALVLGVLATYAIVVSGNIKEERLRRELGAARERTARLEKEAQTLKAQAEADRLARLKIEARIAPRSLTQEQQHELTAKLSQFKDVHGTIVPSPSTQESEWFARVLAAPLIAAGWEMVIAPGTATATVLHPTGVVIWYPIEQHVAELGLPNPGPAASLAEALNEFGIAASAMPGPVKAPKTMAVIIGAK